jgi:Flp pilus assembly protein TadD
LRVVDRVRLAPVSLLVGFSFSLGGVLAAVFPTRREYAQLADDRAPDAYSLAYLQVLTRATPSDEHLRLLYVRHLTQLGRYDEALAALAPALATQPPDAATASLELELLLARARAIPEGDPRRAEAFEAVAAHLEKLLVQPQPAERLAPLARLALELERPRLAADFYERAAASIGPTGAAPMLVEAGRWRLASGDVEGASGLYRQAADREQDPQRSRELALLAVSALEAGDHVAAAADLAGEYLERWPEDRELLQRAADLSSRCERASAARGYGRRLLALDPASEASLERQVQLELAAGDARAALPILRRLLALHPTDPRLHRTRARVAEWAGRPDLALEDWLWLLGRGSPPRAVLVAQEQGSPTLEESGPERERGSRTLVESGPERERGSRTLVESGPERERGSPAP